MCILKFVGGRDLAIELTFIHKKHKHTHRMRSVVIYNVMSSFSVLCVRCARFAN